MTPRLDAVQVPLEEVLRELADAPASSHLGNMFDRDQVVQLSAGAQHQLVACFREATAAQERLEGKLSRARSERRKAELAQRVHQWSRVSQWAQETLLSSLVPLLLSRVDLAVRRHRGRVEPDRQSYLSDAVTCVLEALRCWSADGGADFHQYVASAVDAALSKRSLDGRVAGSMPTAWQTVVKHLPSLIDELTANLGRSPSDAELREAFLARARQWAEARIVEKGGDVDGGVIADLVEAKLKKQGLRAAADAIGDIRARTQQPVSLSLDEGTVSVVSPADPFREVTERDEVGMLAKLVQSIPGLTDSSGAAEMREAREKLECPLWQRLTLHGPLPVVAQETPARRFDALALVS